MGPVRVETVGTEDSWGNSGGPLGGGGRCLCSDLVHGQPPQAEEETAHLPKPSCAPSEGLGVGGGLRVQGASPWACSIPLPAHSQVWLPCLGLRPFPEHRTPGAETSSPGQTVILLRSQTPWLLGRIHLPGIWVNLFPEAPSLFVHLYPGLWLSFSPRSPVSALAPKLANVLSSGWSSDLNFRLPWGLL